MGGIRNIPSSEFPLAFYAFEGLFPSVAALMSCQMLESVESSLTCFTDMNALSVVLGNGFSSIVVEGRMLGDFDHSVDRALLFGNGSDSHLVSRRMYRRL